MSTRDFPWLSEEERFPFPPPSTADMQGIVAMGGNLSPGMLLSAYEQGLFPWYNQGEPIFWWSLDPRFVLYPENLKISKSMKKLFKKKNWTFSLDQAFPQVIRNCQRVPRGGQQGTWITGEMEESYIELHRLGYAHSAEIWEGETLVGGLYGVSLGRVFFGESMFAHESNSSKAAFIQLTTLLKGLGFPFIDCQQHTAHLESLGAEDVSRERFLEELEEALDFPTLKGNWGEILPVLKGSVR